MVTRSKSFIILIKVLGLIWVSSLYACGCRDNGGEGKPNGTEVSRSLRMQIPSKFLLGDSKNIEVTLRCTDDQKPAILEEFRLHVAIIQENGENSQIAYHGYVNGQSSSIKKPAIEENIIHFSNLEQLAPTDDPLKIAFTLMPDPQINKVVTIFKLLDAQGQVVDEERVTWEKEKPSIDILLTRISSEHLRGDRNVKIEIKNQGSQKIEAGQAKLKITRKVGTDVPIIDAVATATPGEYEFKLGELKPGENILQNLKITPETDVNLQLTFQVAYSDSYLSNQVAVDWSQDVQLVLEEIKCNKDTHVITYTIKNTGMDVPKNLQIEYVSKTAGIKLDGVELVPGKPQIKNVDELAAGVPKDNQALGTLDFNGNQSAEFEFRLVYEGDSTKAMPHSFHVKDVDLSIELTYDQAQSIVMYNIKNTGTSKAEGISLKYTNVSDKENPEGKSVLLEKTTTATIGLGSIAANNGETGHTPLTIDFKQADKATFEFELLYNGIAVNQAKKVKTFEAIPIKLALVPITPSMLVGSQQKVKCRIELEPGSRSLPNIDTSKLKLAIVNELNNEAYLSKISGGRRINELAGNELGSIGDEIILHINPGVTKEASFQLVLKYNEEPIIGAVPIHINWKEATLTIIEASNLVSDDIATFKLKNLNDTESIDCRSIVVELVGSNGVEFVLLNSNRSVAGQNITLDKLTVSNLLSPEMLTHPIQFKLANSNGKDKATVTIIVKRDSTTLAKKTVSWDNRAISLKVGFKLPLDSDGQERTDNLFRNRETVIININNAGPIIDINKVKVQLTNEKGVKFKLGDITGDRISSSLKEIIGKDKLEEGELVSIKLALVNAPKDVFSTDLSFNIAYNEKVLHNKQLSWTDFEELYQYLNLEKLNESSEIAEKELDVAKRTIKLETKPTSLVLHQDIKGLVAAQAKFREALEYTKNRFKILSEQNALVSTISARIQNKVIVPNEQIYGNINEYILISLNYIKEKILSFTNTSDSKGQQIQKDFWLNLLIKIVKKNKTKEAENILKEVEGISEEAKDIIKTPEKNQAARKAIHAKAKEENAKTPTRRVLFADPDPDATPSKNQNLF